MDLTNHERNIIEQALKEAIQHSGIYQSKMQYRQVLTKLQGWHTQEFMMETNNEFYDGFRYDYDDESRLV